MNKLYFKYCYYWLLARSYFGLYPFYPVTFIYLFSFSCGWTSLEFSFSLLAHYCGCDTTSTHVKFHHGWIRESGEQGNLTESASQSFPAVCLLKLWVLYVLPGISRSPIALCLSISALRSPLSAKCRLHSEQSSVILLLLLWKAQTWHRLTASVVYPTRGTRAIVQRTWHGILGGNMADGWAPSSAGSQHLRQDSKPNRVSDSQAHI